MRLASTIEIYAGGPGSGCKGSNCGRPSVEKPPYKQIEIKRVGGFGKGYGDWEVRAPEGWRFDSSEGSRHHYFDTAKEAKHFIKYVLLVRSSIEAGGEGSGCRGPNCGRPSTGKKESKSEFQKQAEKAIKGLPPIKQDPFATTPGTPYLKGPALKNIEPAYKSGFAPEPFDPNKKYVPPVVHDPTELKQKSQEAKEAFSKGHHQLTPQEKLNKSILEERDKVVLLQPLKTVSATPPYNTKTYPVGYEATFVKHEQPKYDAFSNKATEAPMAQIKLGKSKFAETVPLNDLQLLEKVKENVAPIAEGKVKPSQTVQSYTAPDGAKVTIVKPKAESAEDESRVRQFWKLEHPLKGQFRSESGLIKGLEDPTRRTQVFFAAPKGAEHAGVLFPTQNVPAKQGTTVYIDRWAGKTKVVVTEINTGQYGHLFISGGKQRSYSNPVSANKFLKDRYDIKQAFPYKKLK